MDTIELKSPLDMHVHFRQGDILKFVAPITAKLFSGALVMPNTNPIIDSLERIESYSNEIKNSIDSNSFEHYMTIYFQTKFTKKFLESVKDKILAVKFYPKNATTNSSHGCDPDDPEVDKVLALMEELNIFLCVHGESTGFVLDREKKFLDVYDRWARKFPKLKIIMEHITTSEAAEFVWNYDNLHATITPQHLLCTLDDMMGEHLNPHLFCKPVLKRDSDRESLVALACGTLTNESNIAKVMLGTDSAPHDRKNKESCCGCAGIFNAPITLQLLAGLFDEVWSGQQIAESKLQQFVSNNAKTIYGINPPEKTVVLDKNNFYIPQKYGDIIPMWAGKVIPWRIVN